MKFSKLRKEIRKSIVLGCSLVQTTRIQGVPSGCALPIVHREKITQFYRVDDMFDFDNVGFSKTVEEYKFLGRNSIGR